MTAHGWQRLIPLDDCYRGEEKFRIDAYSEFMPPPRVGWKPYGTQSVDPQLFAAADPFGWKVSEFEETLEIRPGLLHVARQVLGTMRRLLKGDTTVGRPKKDLTGNPFWPSELSKAGDLPQERFVTLLPLALSRTIDDKGRARWTLFGNSEQGPSKAFWKSFYAAPDKEALTDEGVDFFCKLLQTVYGETATTAAELRDAGFRILPDEDPLVDCWKETPLPSWTTPFLLGERPTLNHVKYLLSFRPFGKLPAPVRKAYLTGKLCLLPFPGSLLYWGVPNYIGTPQKPGLWTHHPLALQIPLLMDFHRHRGPEGMKIPQSGIMHEANEKHPHAHEHGVHVRNTYRRTHRWEKIIRDADELAMDGKDDKLLHVLFSALPDDVSLYSKPMARNVQLWPVDGKWFLNGPKASVKEIMEAMHHAEAGGNFGYRFLFPAMQVGEHEAYWHRPLVAYRDKDDQVAVLPEAPLGYLTAYDVNKIDLDKPVELWPRIQQRPLPQAVLALHQGGDGHLTLPIIRNVRKLFETHQVRDEKPLPRTFARQLLTRRHGQSLEAWIDILPNETLKEGISDLLEARAEPLPRRRGAVVPDSLTYKKTATRAFEVDYWKQIADLSEGNFLNTNNADCVRDEATQRKLPYHERQLQSFGDHLLAYYARKIAAMRMTGQVMLGDMPFSWRTDFKYSWMGGWLANNEGTAQERDLIVMIPGKDRSRAVIMSDHYDTAYMADWYYEAQGGCKARMASCGADDNHSATAAMMMAAPIFMEMSKKGKLLYDVWLIHLTGEEFPADCLGARALTQRLVERTLKLHLPGGKTKDLSKVQIQGLYVSDMIAHNNDKERDVFQISPGTDPAAMWLAYQAHLANEIWNESVPEWNKAPDRAGKRRGRRSPHGGAIPEIAPFLRLSGQVRPSIDPKSTLYNTDGQIFSDAGVPCVLFMENYDIDRKGYHDTHDTMANIDLDYGAAFCAITIESVARAATFERDCTPRGQE